MRKRRGRERKKQQVTGNKIGNEGAKALSEMLRVNTTLKSLNLMGVKKNQKK